MRFVNLNRCDSGFAGSGKFIVTFLGGNILIFTSHLNRLAVTIFVLSSSVVSAAPIDAFALYTFEDGAASDSSGNGRDGTVVAGVTFDGPGHDGGTAASFDAVAGNSGISLPININPLSMPALTMGAWVSASQNVSQLGKVLSHDNGGFDRTLGIDSRGQQPGVNYSAFNGVGVLDAPGNFSSLWTHIAVSYDGTLTNLFIDGLKIATGADNTGTGLTNLFIGANPSFNGEDFSGLIDDVFIFDRVLSDDEISDIYKNGFGEVSTVPLPAGLPMLLASLGLLVGARNRKR